MKLLRRAEATATTAASSALRSVLLLVCAAASVGVLSVNGQQQPAPLPPAPSSAAPQPSGGEGDAAAATRQSCDDDKKYASAWPPRHVVLRLPGYTPPTFSRKREEITIGAMIKVHEHSDSGRQCGPISPMGVLEVQMLVYTVERLNVDGHFPFSIGLLVKDDCGNASYALEESLEFVKGYIVSILKVDRRPGDDDCASRQSAMAGGGGGGGGGGSSGVNQRPPYIAAVVGATGSSSSIQMSNLLKLFKVPQIGYWTTNPELTNKRYYKYYLRTVPNEDDFLEIIGKVVESLNWTYVSIVYEDFPLSKQSQSTMEAILRKGGVCVALSLALKPAEVNSTAAHESLIVRLNGTQARGVILITSETSTLVNQLMRAVRNLGLPPGRFVWLGNRDWSRSPDITAAYAKELEGAITVEPAQKEVFGFRTHLQELDPRTYDKNPWLREWWETRFQCKFGESESHWSPHTCAYQNSPCLAAPEGGRQPAAASVESLLGSYSGLLSRLQLVHDAVMAVAFGLEKMHKLKCASISQTGLCSYMNTTVMNAARNELLLELMQGLRFKDLAHTDFNFGDDGDGPRRFQIFNLHGGPDGPSWRAVGRYSDEEGVQLNTSAMRFAGGNASVPVSVCSRPCAANQAKVVVDSQPCCWSCIDCGEHEWLSPSGSGQSCQPCPLGSRPANDKASCVPIAPSRLTYSHPVSAAALSVASVGIAVTLAVGVLFVVKRSTPVVRAAGREMTFVLLAGILLCYASAFVLTSEPTDVTCVLQNAVPGVSFATCYAAILLKANRIYRIFNSGPRSTRRPRCVSPLSTVCLCAGIVFVQLLITALWLVVRPPHAGQWHPNRTQSYLVCLTKDGGPERGHMVAFAFPMALLVSCIVHAVLTRKIPGAFNESKLIGFTVYTTCIIWLAFVPLYTTAGDDVPIMLATECFAILLSATVSLACVFFPKAYIILFRAEKNARPRGGGTSFRLRTVNNSYATADSPSLASQGVLLEPPSVASSGYHTLIKDPSTTERSSNSVAERSSNSAAEHSESPRGATPSPLDADSKAGAPPAVFFASGGPAGGSGRSPNKRTRINVPIEVAESPHVDETSAAVGDAGGRCAPSAGSGPDSTKVDLKSSAAPSSTTSNASAAPSGRATSGKSPTTAHAAAASPSHPASRAAPTATHLVVPQPHDDSPATAAVGNGSTSPAAWNSHRGGGGSGPLQAARQQQQLQPQPRTMYDMLLDLSERSSGQGSLTRRPVHKTANNNNSASVALGGGGSDGIKTNAANPIAGATTAAPAGVPGIGSVA